jgi:hypothetical protein
MKNLRKTDEVTVEYKGSKIYAFRWQWEEDNDKGVEVTKKNVVCHLYRLGSKNKPLNLGECSNGNALTAPAQAVNEAKSLVDYWLEKEEKPKKEYLLVTFVNPPENVNSDEKILNWFNINFPFYKGVSVEPKEKRKTNVGVFYVNNGSIV